MNEYAMIEEMDRAGLIKEIGAVAAEIAGHEAELRVKTAWLEECSKRLVTLV